MEDLFKIIKRVAILAVVFIGLIWIFLGIERVDAGHVGIMVKLSGTDRGVQNVTQVTGWVFYNRFSYSVYEFPIFVQHKEYNGDESFIVNSKDGSEFHVSPIVNYSVNPDSVPQIFQTYRKTLPEIESGFIKTAVYDAFRIATNGYNADSLISNRETFEHKVRELLDKQLIRRGFNIQQFTSNLTYPETFKKSIEAKNNAVQDALQTENKVKKADAEAKISIVQAEGRAKSLLIQAEAEAKANELKQRTLTPMLIQQQFIESWNGALPVYGEVPKLFKNITN